MTDYEQQRDAIETILLSVADVGRVHNRPRFGDAFDHWIATIGGIDQIRTWEIGLDDPGVETERIQQTVLHRWRNWRIQGYVAVEDTDLPVDSYTLINSLAEQIADALDADFTLAGTCLSHEAVQMADPVTVRLPLAGSTPLCWGVTLTMRTLDIHYT